MGSEMCIRDRCETPEKVKTELGKLRRDMLVSSVSKGAEIGAILLNDNQLYQISHPKFAHVPHGGGDALAAAFLAYSLNGYDHKSAFARAVSAVYDILKSATDKNRRELPLIECQTKLIDVNLLPITRLS